MNEQKQKQLKAKVALSLYEELGRVPEEEEIEQFYRVLYTTIAPPALKKKRPKKQVARNVVPCYPSRQFRRENVKSSQFPRSF